MSLNVPFFWLIHSWFGLAVVADVDVDPAVAVEVGRRDAERRTVGAADERLRRHVLERAVAAIAIQAIRLRPVAVRRAVVALPGEVLAVESASMR